MPQALIFLWYFNALTYLFHPEYIDLNSGGAKRLWRLAILGAKAEGVQVSRGWGLRGVPSPSRLGVWWSVVSSYCGVWGGGLRPKRKFGTFRTIEHFWWKEHPKSLQLAAHSLRRRHSYRNLVSLSKRAVVLRDIIQHVSKYINVW